MKRQMSLHQMFKINSKKLKVDKELKFTGYDVFKTLPNGSCMFQAISHQLSVTSTSTSQHCPSPAEVRKTLVQYLRLHPNILSESQALPEGYETIEEYLKDMEKETTWGDGIILAAAYHCYGRPVTVVYSDDDNVSGASNVVNLDHDKGGKERIFLGFVRRISPDAKYDHYVSLVPITGDSGVNVSTGIEESHASSAVENQPPAPSQPSVNQPPASSQSSVDQSPTPSQPSVDQPPAPSQPSVERRVQLSYPNACKNLAQFQAWQESREWLTFDTDSGSVRCSTCSQVKCLGLQAVGPGQRCEAAFVKGIVKAKNSKTLLKKIDKHRDSLSHGKCEEILESKKVNKIVQSIDVASSLFRERHKENIRTTARIFRTSYECALSHLPFSEHQRLVDLQTLNGIDCGNILYSYHACSNIIKHIACEMRAEIVQHIIESNEHFSLMIDESTSVSNVQSMIIYVRTRFDGKVCIYYLGLVPVTDASASGLEKTLLDFLNEIGLTNEVLSKQFVGFCSDGASCMIGQHKGVATLLKCKYPKIQTLHCMAHRVELVVKNSVDEVNAVSHFRVFVDDLYKLYSMSPKNQRALDSVAQSLAIHLLKVQKIFDVRWVFSSYVAVKAVLRDYPALHAHFCQSAGSMNQAKTKEGSRYSGLAKKLQSWFFVSEACMLKDALRCIKQFSLFLQSNDANIIDVVNHVASLKAKLQALKAENGQSLGKFLASYAADQRYKGVEIVMKESDLETFNRIRGQFFQSLLDNFEQRFPSSDLMKEVGCLNPSLWPSDPIGKALFGEKEIAEACKKFEIPPAEVANVVVDFSVYKQSNGAIVGKNLKKLLDLLNILPVSTADCERGFSQMNLYQTCERNRMLVGTVDNLMMVGINGPPLKYWNAEKYVISWLKSGHHGALDKATGLMKQEIVQKRCSMLFK